jgi:hypothetical protein
MGVLDRPKRVLSQLSTYLLSERRLIRLYAACLFIYLVVKNIVIKTVIKLLSEVGLHETNKQSELREIMWQDMASIHFAPFSISSLQVFAIFHYSAIFAFC